MDYDRDEGTVRIDVTILHVTAAAPSLSLSDAWIAVSPGAGQNDLIAATKAAPQPAAARMMPIFGNHFAVVI
jgi:hypothetical protein